MPMPTAPTFIQLPPEILEEIYAELAYDKETLDALCLTCHALCARTRPYRFPTITLHDQNFNEFMDLTCSTSWNTILPHIKDLFFGSMMFPLSHCYLGRSESEPCWNSDLTNWAAQFSRLRALDLRGAVWSQLPPSLSTALLSLDVENLVVCLRENALRVEDLMNVVLPAMRPKTLMVAGPLWRPKPLPPFPQCTPETTLPNIHYLHLEGSIPRESLADWLKNFDSPSLITHLHIELPRDKGSSYGLALQEILQLVSPIHLQLKLPSSTSRTHFEFPIEAFSDLQTLQISSIANEVLDPRTSLIEGREGFIDDLTVTSRLLHQFSPLQNRLRRVQLDSIYAQANHVYGDIPEVLRTSYPSLELLCLTVRSGKSTHRKDLDAWLVQNPFTQLQKGDVVLRMEAADFDPALVLL